MGELGHDLVKDWSRLPRGGGVSVLSHTQNSAGLLSGGGQAGDRSGPLQRTGACDPRGHPNVV